MEWEKPSQELVDAFDALIPPPPVERRKMFGMPACFVNGHMFAGVFGHTIMLRLPEGEREKLLRNGGEPFAPMGRTMREYVCPPPSLVADRAKLRSWIKKAQAYAESLPLKQPKPRKGAAASRKPPQR